MQSNIEELTSELIRLPRRERLEIVRFLLFLDSYTANSDEVSLAWENEITDRVHAVEEGTAVGIDYEKAIQQITNRFG